MGEPEPAAVAVAQPEPDGSVEAPPKAPCPGTHPEYGDLTPVYVAWYKDNHTADEYAEKYAGLMEIAESQRGGVA